MGLHEALKKARSSFSKKIRNLIGKRDPDLLNDIEDILIQADLGLRSVERLIDALEKVEPTDYYSELQKELIDLLNKHISKTIDGNPPFVELYVGVNGVGKTTTIGKRGYMLKEEGNKVIFASADTYRTGAVEQLRHWGKRIGADVVESHYGADPASVAFDAVDAAIARGMDYLLIDTAGRLHTKMNLMEEMKKIKRVLSKKREDLPHETILVVDANIGKNTIQQTENFNDTVGITGIDIAKLDGTAKGGIVITIVEELGIPIRFLGIGEDVKDLIPFKAKDFVHALFE
ncbi:signal recognition particle-docking protein FtsY [candidate division WOR-3 bacterium]|nr:signal recognition particle-docking protein FtsY [candidate division WOR-3 bacterium]